MTETRTTSAILAGLILGLALTSLLLAISCSSGPGAPSSDPVSVTRIRAGEKLNGECVFQNDLSKYPVSYLAASQDCYQAVAVGPLSLAELDQMKRDEPSFWEDSLPYRQALTGEMIDGECDFSHPAVQAYLEFSETVSTDLSRCVMTVDVGPATEKQIERVQLHGNSETSTAVPAQSSPAPSQ